MQLSPLTVVESVRQKITLILRAENEDKANELAAYVEGYLSAMSETYQLSEDQRDELQREIEAVRAQWGRLSVAQHRAILQLEHAFEQLQANNLVVGEVGGSWFAVVADVAFDEEASRTSRYDAVASRISQAIHLKMEPSVYLRS